MGNGAPFPDQGKLGSVGMRDGSNVALVGRIVGGDNGVRVGVGVGAGVGRGVGAIVGVVDGCQVGGGDGDAVGSSVVGSADGRRVRYRYRLLVGSTDGIAVVGSTVDDGVGACDGSTVVGAGVGEAVGLRVGRAVKHATVGPSLNAFRNIGRLDGSWLGKGVVGAADGRDVGISSGWTTAFDKKPIVKSRHDGRGFHQDRHGSKLRILPPPPLWVLPTDGRLSNSSRGELQNDTTDPPELEIRLVRPDQRGARLAETHL